ncbi:Protein abhd18 [Schistosoma haematobium]|uniref:Protein abhd18 n=1 Tax=Schistosoma haematobium TaxID=6185 RepID=A0A922LKW4_SCHHA|nr:Protein abhd18 [Schistosoma haematobium]KAH9588136.1 Protein abhd18 [Schistosoma haematobium]
MSTFDKIYRSVVPIKFFSEGWGAPDTLMRLIENMKVVTNRDKYCSVNISADVHIEKKTENNRTIQIEGSFMSPFDSVISNALKGDNRIARFQMIIPKKWPTNYRAVCVHFSGTGDHNYYRRRIFLANNLIKDGIASIILMNPFYSKRKPDDQQGSSLKFVSDLFIMGGALIMECSALLEWCERNGYGPFALHGISMGGYMSSLCATVWPKPISLIPCLSWTSASCVFLEGILSNTVDWPVLTKQYYSDSVYSDVIRPRIQPPIPEFYKTTDETFNDNLGDNLQYSTISINSLHSKHSNPVNVAPLATFSKQLDSRLHPIKRNPLKSSYSSFQVRDLLSQFINISNSTSQLSSSHSNTHKFTIAQKFLPSFM